MNQQSINIMKILVAVMQLLSKAVRTDRQTDVSNLRYAPLKFITEKMLRIIEALANHPVVPDVITISQLALPLVKQSTACGKEAELDHSSHSYFIHSPHEPLLQFRHKTNKTINLSTYKNFV